MYSVEYYQCKENISIVHVKYHLPLECVKMSNMRVNVIAKIGDAIETVSKIGDVHLEGLKIQVSKITCDYTPADYGLVEIQVNLT